MIPGDAAPSYSHEEERHVLRMEQQEARGARTLTAFSSSCTLLVLPTSVYFIRWMYQFPIVAITNYHKLSDLKMCSPAVLEGRSPRSKFTGFKVKVLVGLVLSASTEGRTRFLAFFSF